MEAPHGQPGCWCPLIRSKFFPSVAHTQTHVVLLYKLVVRQRQLAWPSRPYVLVDVAWVIGASGGAHFCLPPKVVRCLNAQLITFIFAAFFATPPDCRPPRPSPCPSSERHWVNRNSHLTIVDDVVIGGRSQDATDFTGA